MKEKEKELKRADLILTKERGWEHKRRFLWEGVTQGERERLSLLLLLPPVHHSVKGQSLLSMKNMHRIAYKSAVLTNFSFSNISDERGSCSRSFSS